TSFSRDWNSDVCSSDLEPRHVCTKAPQRHDGHPVIQPSQALYEITGSNTVMAPRTGYLRSQAQHLPCANSQESFQRPMKGRLLPALQHDVPSPVCERPLDS